MATPSLSVCIIARDEEAVIARAIESVAGLASEVIVGDTGSRDRTKAIAQQQGAMVIELDGEHDASRARNQVLEQANGDWVLFLAADEHVSKSGAAWLKANLSSLTPGLYSAWVASGGPEGYARPSMMLFANGLGVRYHGQVHEYPTLTGRSLDAVTHLSDLLVHQSDAHRSAAEVMARHRHCLQVLDLDLIEHGPSFHRHFHAGVSLEALGRHDEAMERYSQAYDMVCEQGAGLQAATVAAGAMRTAAALGSADLMLTWADRILAAYPAYVDSRSIAADAHLAAERWEAALEHLEAALDGLATQAFEARLPTKGMQLFHPLVKRYALAAMKLGRWQEADARLAELGRDDRDAALMALRLHLHLSHDAVEEAAALYLWRWAGISEQDRQDFTAVPWDDPYARGYVKAALWVKLAADRTYLEAAQSELLALTVQYPDRRDAYVLLAAIAAKDLRHQDAAAHLQAALSHYPGDADMMAHLAVCHANQGHFDQAITQFHQVLAIQPDHPAAKAGLATLQAR